MWNPSKLPWYYKACYFGCLKGVYKSVSILLIGIDAAMVLTLITLK